MQTQLKVIQGDKNKGNPATKESAGFKELFAQGTVHYANADEGH